MLFFDIDEKVSTTLYNTKHQNSSPQKIKALPTLPISDLVAKSLSKSVFCTSYETQTNPLLAYRICDDIHRKWGNGFIHKKLAFEKMVKNLAKAIIEHAHAAFKEGKPNVFINEKHLPTLIKKNTHHFLTFETGHAETQGKRNTFNESCFSLALKNGILVGVFDGNTKEVADFICKRVQTLFPQILNQSNGNVHAALEDVFSIITNEVAKNKKFITNGCTAATCYIENKTNRIYTATLGNCEANLYRKIEDNLVSIPLSCIRNWGSKRDQERANIATEGEYQGSIANLWKANVQYPHQRSLDCKKDQFKIQNKLTGIKHSRAFGYLAINKDRPVDAIITKPKISICNVLKNDILVLATFEPEVKNEDLIVECIANSAHKSPSEISANLIEATKSNESYNNASVVTVKINKSNLLKKVQQSSHFENFTNATSSLIDNPIPATKQVVPRICQDIHRPWGQGLIDKIQAMKKMQKNLIKAKKEHIDAFNTQPRKSKSTPFFAPYDISIPYEQKPIVPLKLEAGHAQAQGPRHRMEDAHFCISLPDGMLAGVLDGHGGKAVAEYASMRIQKLFQPTLKKHDNNVHQAFEEVISIIQEEIHLEKNFLHIGSTAVFCYIQNSTNCVITATIGDSEANIYRGLKSIPLSCVRDWTSPKDSKRVDIATQDEYAKSILYYWQNLSSKKRRLSPKIINTGDQVDFNAGLNVSRAFGDQKINIFRSINSIIAKPKITICRLEPDDILTLVCDGVKDFIDEDIITDYLSKQAHRTAEKISQKLVWLASQFRTRDNVTVLTIKIKKL